MPSPRIWEIWNLCYHRTYTCYRYLSKLSKKLAVTILYQNLWKAQCFLLPYTASLKYFTTTYLTLLVLQHIPTYFLHNWVIKHSANLQFIQLHPTKLAVLLLLSCVLGSVGWKIPFFISELFLCCTSLCFRVLRLSRCQLLWRSSGWGFRRIPGSKQNLHFLT